MFYKTLGEFKDSNGYEIDGLWYPRVTSIISIKAKPALYKFYAEQSSFASAEAIKNKSAEEGSLLHETVEAILAGQDLLGQGKEISEIVRPAVVAFLDFKKQNEIIAHKIEEKIISKKHRYAGTLDCLAEVNGELGVLDIKTSQAIYRDYGIQTAAYVEALRESPDMPPLKRWILRIDQARYCIKGCGALMREKGGRQKIKLPYPNRNPNCSHAWSEIAGEVEIKELFDLEKDTQAFLAAKALWEWEHDYWLGKIK